jgi:hypothetical protein
VCVCTVAATLETSSSLRSRSFRRMVAAGEELEEAVVTAVAVLAAVVPVVVVPAVVVPVEVVQV